MPVAAMARSLLGARPGEERAVVLAFAYFFLLLCSYYLLRPVRDAMAANAGLARLPELFTYTFFAMLAITPLFGALVSRVRKRRLLPVVYGFFAANMFLFYLAFASDPGSVRAAATFFVWLSVFNMFVVSVFWSFMADVFRGEEARRLFGPIAAGGSAGAILGPILTQSLAGQIGTAGLILLSTGLLLATIPCIHALGHWSVQRHGEAPGTAAESVEPIGGGALAGIGLVMRSPYLLGIVLVLALGAGVGSAAVAESMDSTIRGTKGILATLQMAPLAVIPYMANAAETGAQRRKRIILFASVVAGIIVVLLLVHFLVSPLDVLWFRGMRKVDNIVGE